MIYHLLWSLQEIVHKVGFYAYQDVFFRCLMATLTSAVIAFIVGPRIICWLKTKKINDQPEFHNATINELNKEKRGTPTMGGLIILIAMLSGTLLWAKLNNPFVQKATFLVVWFGVVGCIDDWLKLTSKNRPRSRHGLKPWEKLTFQFGGAILVALFLFNDFTNIDDGQRFWLPFYKHGLPLASWAFVLIAII